VLGQAQQAEPLQVTFGLLRGQIDVGDHLGDREVSPLSPGEAQQLRAPGRLVRGEVAARAAADEGDADPDGERRAEEKKSARENAAKPKPRPRFSRIPKPMKAPTAIAVQPTPLRHTRTA